MPGPDARGHTVALNGADLYYEVHGDGEPLLLLHGGTGAGVNWRLIFDFDAPPKGYRPVSRVSEARCSRPGVVRLLSNDCPMSTEPIPFDCEHIGNSGVGRLISMEK